MVFGVCDPLGSGVQNWEQSDQCQALWNSCWRTARFDTDHTVFTLALCQYVAPGSALFRRVVLLHCQP